MCLNFLPESKKRNTVEVVFSGSDMLIQLKIEDEVAFVGNGMLPVALDAIKND